GSRYGLQISLLPDFANSSRMAGTRRAKILGSGGRIVRLLPQLLPVLDCTRSPYTGFPHLSECYGPSDPDPRRPALAAGWCTVGAHHFGPRALGKCRAIRLFATHDDSYAKKYALATPLAWGSSGPNANRAQHRLFLLWRVVCMAGAKCQRRKGPVAGRWVS